MVSALILASATAAASCWQVYDDALRHSAESQHPPYIQYDERISINADDRPLVVSRAHIDYRDDGMARVTDARFDNYPFITRQTEPGPPVIGPYGAERLTWLPLENGQYKLISDVRNRGDARCSMDGVETYKGHSTYHLSFTHVHNDRPQLKGLWVDTNSDDIWKIVLSGYIYFTGSQSAPPLANFEVELGYSGPYLMVNHVVWAYREREYSQWDDYFGEYYFSDFHFPEKLPAETFAQAGSPSG